MPRYTVSGIPDQLASGEALGLSAFLPYFNRLAASGAQAYKGQVRGGPAYGVPITGMGLPVPSPDLGDLAQVGTSRSSDAPNGYWRDNYWIDSAADGPDGCRYYPGAGMPVQIYDPVRPQDTTMIPVPATDLRAAYQKHSARLQNPAAQAGDNSDQGALKQKTAFARWAQRKIGPVNWTQRDGSYGG